MILFKTIVGLALYAQILIYSFQVALDTCIDPEYGQVTTILLIVSEFCFLIDILINFVTYNHHTKSPTI